MALNRSSKWLWLCVVFALCFTLRVGVGAVIDATVTVIKRADVYSDIAANLVRGHGFVAEAGGEPIIWRAPLYPAFLAAVYALFGEQNETGVFLVQCALDSVTSVLIFYMGVRLFGETVGLLSAVSFAVHPLSAYYSLRLLPESLFTLTFTAVIAAWISAVATRRFMAYMVVGALIAVTSLVKPVALGLWPLLAAYAICRLRDEPGRALTSATALTLACLIVLVPWALRNYRVTGEIVAVATGGGYALWLGNQMVSEGKEDWEVDETTRAHLFERRDAIIMRTEPADQAFTPVSNYPLIRSTTQPVHISVPEDHAFFLAAWREIASHPFDTMLLTVRKLFRFFFKVFLPENRWAQSYIILFQSLFLGVASLGMLEARRQGVMVFALILPILFLAAVYSMTFSTIRYSIPTIPILSILSAAGLRAIVHALNERWGLSLGVSWVRWLRAAPVGAMVRSYRETRL